MNPYTLRSIGRRLATLGALALGCLSLARAGESVAVFSTVFNGYQRSQLADGTFAPETYAFGEGGALRPGVHDPDFDKLTFLQVANAAIQPLERLNFRQAQRSSETDLLILVFWGATPGSRNSDPTLAVDVAVDAIAAFDRTVSKGAMPASTPGGRDRWLDGDTAEEAAYESALWQLSVANAERDRVDYRNARILGYSDSLDRAHSARHMAFSQDLIQEISGSRYYVVLQAYDFRTARQHRKLKPLWTARMSVGDRGNFSQALDKLVWSGASYFGRASDGLRRTPARDGRVEMAPMDVIEVVPEK